MADAHGLRQQQPQRLDEDFGRRIGDGCFKDISDPEMPRRGGGVIRPTQKQFGRGDTRPIPQWWQRDPADEVGAFESQLGRVAYGVADRVHRLKAIGNGQVPLVAATAFNVLKKGI